jgi:hypothetical protein
MCLLNNYFSFILLCSKYQNLILPCKLHYLVESLIGSFFL